MRFPHHIMCVLAALLFILVACGGSEAVSEFVPPTDETYPGELVEQGKETYRRHCTSCHAADGSGGVGPNIRQVWEHMSLEEQTALMIDGRNQMPEFGGTLTQEEIEAVVAYTRVGW